MITFVLWVNNKELFGQFLKSITFPCNIIPLGQTFTSLSEAYREGQRINNEVKNGDIIIYCHQDIIIHDPNFDKKVHQFFDTHIDVGFVGVIGNNKIAPREWWLPEINRRGYIRQSDHTGKTKPTVFNFGKETQNAAQLDGCFLMTNRGDWDFPKELPGIHFLDLWMCNRATERGFQNWILDIDIEHTSWGETGSESFKNNYEIYKKRWHKLLNSQTNNS